MSAEKSTIRLEVLFIDGTLSLLLGLALLYLQGMITNPIFDVVAAVSAVLLSAGIFFMIAIVDFLAAASSGIRRLRDVVFYTIVGLAFAVGGLLLLLGPPDATNVLLALVIVHGLASGFLGIVAAHRSSFSRIARIIFYSFSVASIAISGIVAALAKAFDHRTALGWTGFYLSLVGVKLLLLAGFFQYQALHPTRLTVASAEKSVQ